MKDLQDIVRDRSTGVGLQKGRDSGKREAPAEGLKESLLVQAVAEDSIAILRESEDFEGGKDRGEMGRREDKDLEVRLNEQGRSEGDLRWGFGERRP